MIEKQKDAIKVLRDIKGHYQLQAHGFQMSLDMAIKALEQEPCDDCISRQAVDELSKELVHTTRDKADFLCNFWERLQKLPPVTPKEKTGKWIKYGTPRCGEQHYQCTNCGWYINFGQWGDVYTKQFKYCPNCSADMRGDTNENSN